MAEETSATRNDETTKERTPEEGSTDSRKRNSGAEVARFGEEREKIEELLQVDIGTVTKSEVSASTVVKMMGLSTSSELKLIEGKIDLLSGRLGNLSIRLERVMNLLNNVPSVSDFERVESQIASLRSMFKEIMVAQKPTSNQEEKVTKEKLQAYLNKNQSDAAPSEGAQSAVVPTDIEKK